MSTQQLQKSTAFAVLTLASTIASLLGVFTILPHPEPGLPATLAVLLGQPLPAVIAFIVIVGQAATIVVLSFCLFKSPSKGNRIEGRRLFEYKGLYPIDIAPGTNIPSLNADTFDNALDHLLTKAYDRLAAMDL